VHFGSGDNVDCRRERREGKALVPNANYLVAIALVINLFRTNSFFFRSSGDESSTSSCCIASLRADSIFSLLQFSTRSDAYRRGFDKYRGENRGDKTLRQ